MNIYSLNKIKDHYYINENQRFIRNFIMIKFECMTPISQIFQTVTRQVTILKHIKKIKRKKRTF